MIKLGLNTWLWTDIFTEEHLFCVKTIKDLGAETVDFSINAPHLFPTKKIKSLIKEYNLEPITSTALSLEYNPISPDKNIRKRALEYMKNLIDITAELEAKISAGVNYAASGYHTGIPRTRQELEWSIEHMENVTRYAKEYNITMAIEPVKRFESHLINTAEQAIDYLSYINYDNIGIHLDTFHMNIEEDDIPKALEKCGNKLVYLHFPDSNRGVPGMGHIPWMDIFKTLKRIDYNGAACIETFNPQTLSKTCSLTYLNRKFGENPEILSKQGLEYLKHIRNIVYNEEYNI